jgi:hypothetical protein
MIELPELQTHSNDKTSLVSGSVMQFVENIDPPSPNVLAHHWSASAPQDPGQNQRDSEEGNGDGGLAIEADF